MTASTTIEVPTAISRMSAATPSVGNRAMPALKNTRSSLPWAGIGADVQERVAETVRAAVGVASAR